MTPLEAASAAILHILTRIRDNPAIAYHMGKGTETWEQITAAYASMTEQEAEAVREQFQPTGV